jgi:hypothetical protein
MTPREMERQTKERINRMHFFDSKDTKAIAFDYIAKEKDNGNKLTVEAENAVYEFVTYFINCIEGEQA